MPRDIVDLVAQYSRKRSTPTSYENLALLQSPSQRQRLLGARMANQQYTGSGPDGIVQTDRPVEMVNTTRGPRMIHEGEVKQQNRDGSTTVIPNNRISAQQQQRLMTLEQQGNVPGYKTGGRYTPSYGGTGSGSGGLVNPGKGYTPGGAGGVPYNPRHTPGATGGGTGGGGLVNLGKGHTPGGAGGVPYNPYLDGAGGYTPPNHTPGTIRTPGATGGGTGDGGGWDPVTLRPRSSRDYREKNRTNAGGVTDPLVIAKGNDLWHNKSRFDSVPSASGIPDTGAEQVTVDGPALTLTPVSTGPVIETPPPGTPDPVSSGMDEGYGIVRDVARGQSDASRRARDYYGESINMAGASEDARILQQLIAQGYSPQEAQAYLLTRRRDRDVAKGQMFGQMGIAEAERAEQAGRDLVTLGIQRGRYDLERQKYGDAETQRMAADIAAGLSYQQMVEKYPNLSRSDYENMSDTILYEQNQQRRTDSFNSTAGYVDQQIATNPDYVSSGAWKTDEMMLNFLGEQWKAFGGNGEFDLSNPVHSAWAEAQVESMAMSDLEVAISQYRSQDWYKELDDDEREDVDALFAVLPKLEATQGYQLNENPDGSTYITGPDGTVAYGSKQGGAGGFSSQDVDAVVDWVALNVGKTVEPGRAAEWLRQNGGVMPESAAEWNSWNSSVPTESNLHEFFSGTGGVELTAADRDALPRVLEAVNAVNEGSATAEQEALAAQYPEISSYKTIKSSFKGSFSGNVDDNKTEGLGNIKVFGSYNPDVYSTSWIYNGDRRQAWRNRDGVNFNFTQKFIDSVTGENAGAIINNNGQYYQVATDNPFVTKAFKADFTEGDDTWDMTYNVQGLRVLNLATGQEEVLYFDHKVDWSDT